MRRITSRSFVASLLAAAALAVAVGISPAEAKGGGKPGPKGKDTVAPTLTLPADITTAAMAPMGAGVTFSVTVTDDKDPAPVIVISKPSGSTFPVGTTTVTVTATDWRGNSTTGTFHVTVTPMTGPVAYKETWVAADGVTWYEWDITVSPDGTVSGVGHQTNLIVVDVTWWETFGYASALPPALSGSGVVSGTISADGTFQLTSSRNYWYANGYSDGSFFEFDANGSPVYHEDLGGFAGSMTASCRNGGIVFSGSPLDVPEISTVYDGYNIWMPQ